MRLPEIAAARRDLHPQIQGHLDSLTKPVGSLGMLEDTALKLALIQNTVKPRLEKKMVYVFASDHGVALEGVSAYPQEVTREMVLNFLKGGAAINVFSRHTATEVFVIDAGVKYDLPPGVSAPNFISKKVGYSTKNFLKEPAMSEPELEQALGYGFDLAQKAHDEKADILVLGDMGIGNTTVATAVACACGIDGESLIDIGTVIDSRTLKLKGEVIRKALAFHNPDPSKPLEILRTLGGFCIAEMVGTILKAASLELPVILDGYPVTAAGLLAYKLNPNVKDYLFAGHCSAVKGHKVLLDHIGLVPMLQLKMRLGEGTGGVLAISLIEAAVKMSNEMATFESANVSRGNEEKTPSK